MFGDGANQIGLVSSVGRVSFFGKQVFLTNPSAEFQDPAEGLSALSNVFSLLDERNECSRSCWVLCNMSR